MATRLRLILVSHQTLLKHEKAHTYNRTFSNADNVIMLLVPTY